MPRLSAITVLVAHAAVALADEAFVEAARRRQDAVRTADVRFTLTETWKREAFQVVVPPGDLTVASANRIVLDGAKVRVEDNHPVRLGGTYRFLHPERIGVFDGVLERSFYPRGTDGESSASGILHRPGKSDGVRHAAGRPIALALRGVTGGLGFPTIDKFKATGATLEIDGSPCDEVAFNDAKAWLDPARGHVVRRSVIAAGNGRTYRENATYRPHPACGFVPSGWVVEESLADGTVVRTVRAEITSLEINGDIPLGTFQVEFPTGCRLSDQTTVPATDYLVTKAGWQPIPANWTPPPPWQVRYRWLLVAAAVLAGIGGAAVDVAIRRRRKPAKPSL